MRLVSELRVALQSVRLAAAATQLAAEQMLGAKSLIVQKTADKSPVTVADWSAQAIVSWMLEQNYPEDRLVAEEDPEQLRTNHQLLEQALGICRQILPSEASLTSQRLLDLISRGSIRGREYSDSKRHVSGRYWTLDPVDGTKGFIRREQYAVCLALIDADGQVDLAALACPNLPLSLAFNGIDPEGRGVVYYAVRGEGAYQASLSLNKDESNDKRIQANAQLINSAQARFCESVESGHSSHSASSAIAAHLSNTTDPIRMDSQCKYGIVASGQADLYLRLPVKEEYVENIWDHAAGDLIVREAGGCVTDMLGRPLDFSTGGPKLINNRGVIASCNPTIHAAVLSAIQTMPHKL